MTPQEEYDAWYADRKAKIAALPTPLTVAAARKAAARWAVEYDDTTRIQRRTLARVRPYLRVEWTRPNTQVTGSSIGYVLHIHGAAQSGSAASYRPLAAQIAGTLSAAVAMLEYRRPPETQFPSVVDEVEAALSWLEATRKPLSRTILSGDSFGAMPALTVTMRRRDAGRAMPAGLYFLCPDCDNSNKAFLATRPRDPDPVTCIQTSAMNQFFPETFPCNCPEAAPGLQDLTGLPPILMHESRDNPLVHALNLRDALENAGANMQFYDWPSTPHIFPVYGSAFTYTAEAMQSLKTWAVNVLE